MGEKIRLYPALINQKIIINDLLPFLMPEYRRYKTKINNFEIKRLFNV